MRIISSEEMKKAVTDKEMIDSIEESFHVFATENFTMPDRLVVSHEEDSMLYMPCLTKDIIGTKMLSLFPKNPSKGKPLINGLMILTNREDGSPMALMDGQLLTAMRTGAVGGHAIRHLAHQNSKSLGLVGCGVQGLYQIKYACAERSIETVYLYDPFKEDLSSFIRDIKHETGHSSINCVVCADSSELVKQSDIIITATSSKEPVLPNDVSLLRGKCIVSIGSWRPDMREVPDAIWQLVETVYTELPYACEETGDLSYPLAKGMLQPDQVCYMADYLKELKKGTKVHLGETRFYKSVGMSLFDLVVAKNIFQRAKEKNIGQNKGL